VTSILESTVDEKLTVTTCLCANCNI